MPIMVSFRIVFFWRYACVIALCCATLVTASALHDGGQQVAPSDVPNVYEADDQHVMRPSSPHETSTSASNPKTSTDSQSHRHVGSKYHSELRHSLNTMQDLYFSIWLGKWTTAIDWTAAVMGTYVSATLSSLSQSIDYRTSGTSNQDEETLRQSAEAENEINKLFSQSISSYYGEEAFSIRMQAYDDILWVVLEWLESIKFIDLHSSSHYASMDTKHSHWHGEQFVPAFAHRARVFYELSEQGWDWRLCGGGMTWNPRLNPYKNAITNQLFISASVSMYLHFPGDTNCSPFLSSSSSSSATNDDEEDGCTTRGPRDPIFLQNAINGYEWLQNSGMLNSAGLYTDGFHISNYRTNKSATTCDDRNDMVYTYNQGVILSGLRNLWIATANTTFLESGHELVRNVISATGYLADDDDWHGLGRNGILAEACDEGARCNQDGQTFKGIFFHHLTAFCGELPRAGDEGERDVHRWTCQTYAKWVERNAGAALRTRDAEGRFGGWWGAAFAERISPDTIGDERWGEGTVDYRNFPERLGELDILPGSEVDFAEGKGASKAGKMKETKQHPQSKERWSIEDDPNDRGRGRTLETQGSGLAVVRAAYEFRKLSQQDR
ncbi:hypothetical protein DE146DRAFT_753195 [Phaeosphaeria sp. MPI-PUGE-AT-0046c]|nr:hypothetical protein DE146DRAFT_753195 [Phaeosphaeria sp. MPI-PUGE-AT-0046c]